MSERWVQSKYSQDAEKWKVISERGDYWQVQSKKYTGLCIDLFKDEYIECAAPEVWAECTREVIKEIGHCLVVDFPCAWPWSVATVVDGYRWSWRDNALVIERKQP